MAERSATTYAFIDASNLFYGGEKSLGWKIDYEKLLDYLEERYGVSRALYFGGVEIHGLSHNYLSNETVDIGRLEAHLVELSKNQQRKLNEAELALLARHLRRLRFYRRLAAFGYELHLKPVKTYEQDDGTTRRKANCDVEMAFQLMLCKDQFSRLLFLSGDGDFLPVLKHLRSIGKEIIVLARGQRTAREIRQFASANFRDLVTLEGKIRFEAS